MVEPFIAKGSEPEWQMIFKILVHMEPGQVLDYQMLDKILGRPFLDSRTPIYRARQELLQTHGRLLRNVSGVGYRVAPAEENEDAARGHIRAGHRQIIKAKDVTEKTPMGDLTPAQRKSLGALRTHLVTVAKATAALNRRVNGKHPVEDTLEAVRQEAEVTKPEPEATLPQVAAKVEHLEALLERFSKKSTSS